MKTAAAYIRVSTDEQAEYSPESQLKAIRAYAKTHDIILPEDYIYVDEGISGRRTDKRVAFQEMIGTAKLKPKPFDCILLWKFSRFARNRQDSIVYKSMLRKQCGIDVISVSEQLSEDNTSILIEALIEAMDEYYSLNLAEEVKRGMNEKFSRGEVVSQPPFGYSMGDGIFVPDESNAEIVRMIFSDFISGMGTRHIAKKLNDMGIRSTKGNLFENRTVEYILTNPVYTGKLRRSRNGRDTLDRFHDSEDNTVIVEGRHQPIISEEVFHAAQERRSEIKRSYVRHSRQSPVEFMLKGIVRCDTCGATLTMMSSGKYLQCHNYARGTCRVSHCVSLKKLNEAVMERLENDFRNQTFNIDIESKQDNGTKAPADVIIESERKKLQRVKEAYEAGVDTLDEYRENKEKILRRISELEASAEPAVTRSPTEIVSGNLETGLVILRDPDTSETLKNLALHSITNRIIFIKPSGRIEVFYHL